MARPRRGSNRRREQNVYVFVACEGETEQNYFKNVVQPYLNAHGAPHVRLTVQKRSKISEIESVMRRAPYDYKKVLYVCDLDVCTSQQAAIGRLGSQIEAKVRSTASNKSEKWETVYTYPMIEFWYLLHQEALSRSFATAPQVLNEFVRKCSWYDKPMPTDRREAEWFLDRVETAIKNECAITSSNSLGFSCQIRPSGPELTNPMSEIGGAISDLLILTAI